MKSTISFHYATRGFRFPIAVCALAVTALSSSSVRAQDVGVKEEATGLGSSSLLTGTSAGGGDGLATVDGVTGAARATLAIDLPRARGRAQPALGLHYNSQKGIAEAGLGWSLEMPSITQRRLWNSPADDQPATRIFEFEGHPLVPVCVIGQSGTCDTSESQPWANGWTYYRRQVEGGYERFYLSPNQNTWRVLRKDGVVDVYGCLDTFQVSGIPTCSAIDIDDRGLSGSAPGSTINYRWNLAASYDLQGGATSPLNLVAYQWAHLDNATQPTWGIGYLTDIYYTPPLNAPPGGPGSVMQASSAYHVHLSYVPSAYPGIGEAPIWRAIPSHLISGVDLTSKKWNESSAARILLRRYHLAYATGIPDGVGEGPYLPELTSFQLEGRCPSPTEIPEGTDFTLPETSCDFWPATNMAYAPWATLPLAKVMSDHEADTGSNFQAGAAQPENAALIDINGDGLPDVVEPELYDYGTSSWDNTHLQRVLLNGVGSGNSPGVDLLSYFLADPDYGTTPFFNAWPVSSQILSAGSAYHDVDSGETALSHPVGRTYVGDWFANGMTSVIFSPFGAAEVCPGCFDTAVPVVISPSLVGGAWKWSYATPPGTLLPSGVPPYTDTFIPAGFDNPSSSIPVDINGDGLLDSINITPWCEIDAQYCYAQLRIQFSQRLFPNQILPFTPAATTYRSPDPHLGASYVPGQYACGYETFSDVAGGGIFAYDFANPTTADLNGDGFPDLFANGKVIFGNGTNFDCQGITSGPDNHDGVPVVSPISDWKNEDGITYWLHDLNGDARADLIVASADGLAAYLNQGAATVDVLGREMKSVVFSSTPVASYAASTIAAMIGQAGNSDAWQMLTDEFTRLPCSSSIDTGCPLSYPSVRISFADMNGSGTDDLVLIAANPSQTNQVVQYVEFEHATDSVNGRAGLLTSITNGFGASTTIQYKSLAQVANDASFGGTPWTEFSPQVMYVATDIQTKNNIGGDSERDVETQFAFRDPAYDAWRRQFKGFRDVTTTKLGRRTETKYQIVTCQDVGTIGASITGTNPYPDGECETNSDRDLLMSLPPLRVVSRITDSAGTVPLVTTHWQYQLGTLATGTDARSIYQAYVSEKDVYLWDKTGATGIAQRVVDTSWSDGNNHTTTVSENLFVPSMQSGSGKRLMETNIVDGWGNVTNHVEYGQVTDAGAIIDSPIQTQRVMQIADRGLAQSTTILPFAHATGVPDGQSRQTTYQYDGAGNLTYEYGIVTGSVHLDRFHATGGAVAPEPSTESMGTWTGSQFTAVHNTYDSTGFLLQAQRPDNQCVSYTADADYGQLVTSEGSSPSGCSTPTISTTYAYERGFQKATTSTTTAGVVTAVTLDDFGQPKSITESSPTTFGVGGMSPQWTIAHYVSDDGHFYIEDATREDGARILTYRDGLGATVLRLQHADGTDGVSGFVASRAPINGFCGPSAERKPWVFGGSATNAYAPADGGRSSTPTGAITYDTFCRVITAADFNGVVQAKREYHPLLTTVSDAADLDTGDSVNYSTPSTVIIDGHGRTIQTIARSTDNTITTSYTYQSTGEVNTIVRSGTKDGKSYKRWMQYDSLGRMVLNAEPNTTAAFSSDPASTPGMHAWKYAYDDAGDLVGTSDARGCGENIAYDAMGRVTSEDYSPCLAAQAAYTASPELTYVYDAPEAQDVDPAGDIVDYGNETSVDYGANSGFLNGRLVAIRDRAVHSRFAYDGRGRSVGVSRQLALPVAPTFSLPYAPPLYTPPETVYDPTWFRKAFVYTDWDTLQSETTGANQAALMGSDGTSTITFATSQRGLTTSISGSYGPLFSNATYDIVGSSLSRTLGDLANTTEVLTYDNAERLQTDVLSRSAPALWSSAPGTYVDYAPPPPDATTQLVLRNDTLGYDDVGNVKSITDARSAGEWKDGAKPSSVQHTYDAFYQLTATTYSSNDTWVSPFDAENQGGSKAPIPALEPSTGKRVQSQTFSYDSLGNLALSTDDSSSTYDRSIGVAAFTAPNQMTAFGPSATSKVTYDSAGNTIGVLVSRSGTCTGPTNACVQIFAYDWDEVGNLVRARRWDYPTGPGSPPTPSAPTPAPATTPTWDVAYAYDASGQRVERKTTDDSGNVTRGAEIFDTLRLDNVAIQPSYIQLDFFNTAPDNTYAPTAQAETVLLPGGIGRLVYDPTLPSPGGKALHVFLQSTDRLGSTSTTIDKETSELVEAETYQSYGATDSDYRPTRWDSFREAYRFTGKEDDIQAGITYFGARYYMPNLGRWLSADPLTVHGLGSDLNPYAYVNRSPTTAVDPWGLDGDGSYTIVQVDTPDTFETLTVTPPPQVVPDPMDMDADISDPNAGAGAPPVGLSPGSMTYQQWADADRSTVLGIADAFVGIAQTVANFVGGSDRLNQADRSIRSQASNDHGFRLGQIYGTLLSLLLGGGEVRATEGRLANLLADATGGVPTTASSAVADGRMAAIRQLGTDGETAANILKNTERIPSATGTAAYRIPDVLDHGAQVIGDVKNVGKLSYTNQLRDFASYAQANGYQFQLTVRTTTQLSEPLSVEVANGNIILRFLP